MIRLSLVVTLLFWLSACGENPPVPVDHFYQLSLENSAVPPVQLTDKVIYVEGIRADGIYNERALLYSEDTNQHELQQYHYHFWALPPADMLREHLVGYLRQAGSAPMVISDFRSGTGLGISGKLLAFEKRVIADQVSVRVAVELRLDVPGQEAPQLIKRYEADQPVTDPAMRDVIAGFNQTVDRIYGEFLTDASQSLQTDHFSQVEE